MNQFRLPICALTFSGLALFASAQEEDPVTQLEKFIAAETALEDSDTLLPTSRPVDSLYGFGKGILDTPRAVTVITPEASGLRGLDDVYDLTQLVPGSTVTNYYGVPGIPTIRGLFSGIDFNGMQRVWNRNGYPTSFGSLESMDYVRGPAPGNYSAASPGGFVNFLPKSPYFDKRRGSVKASYGSYDEFNVQVDVGGPVLLFDQPAAFRVSITNQMADSYYSGIKNDYFSAYGSLKVRLSDNVSIVTGGEFYRHRAKENPGWNRVTQDLIDKGEYLIGSPVNDLTGPSLSLTLPSGASFTWVNTTSGSVNRAALETATPFGGTRGNFDGSFLAQQGFADSGFRPNLVASSANAAYLYSYFGAIDNPTGQTVNIDGSSVLPDNADFTDADTFLYFFYTIFTPSDTLKFTNKFFVDAYKREKVSTYGYGELGENLTIENKFLFEPSFDVLSGINMTYGLSARYEDSIAKTEFTVEPFSRRDITQPATANDTLKSGGQRDNNGKTFWDPFGS
ncbi:MAG: TonB-dependent receptor plug domain-containing protein [Candidatus Synoicihabitans palmerolidicus]|nr:TonB-dependent receptor plug domain-containing protein [Candidatus Synoicihabitans palmerolidicus]